MRAWSWIGSTAFFVMAAAFWLIPAEFAARFWVSNWADPLQRARVILTPDAHLGWRQKPNLDTTFEGTSLRTDANGFRFGEKSETRPTTLVMGPSSAFGWGVEYDETWAARLGRLFPRERVLNASEIGYSLPQGRRLYSELTAGAVDLSAVRTVILAYGVNDIDRFHFFGEGGSDEKYFRGLEPNATQAEMLWGTTAISSLLFRAFQESRQIWNCKGNVPPKLRVSFEDFEDELRLWVMSLKREGKRVVLVNSARQMPFAANLENAATADQLFQQSAEAANRGDCGHARELFRRAKEYETRRVLRDIDRINQIIAGVGQDLRIPVADLAAALVSTNPKELFVDPIHPSAEGHRRATEEIASAMQ